MCDQAKPVLVQNCYLAIFIGLQPKKSLDEYAKQGKLMLDGGMIRLPDPDTLTEGWEDLLSSTQHCSECNGKLFWQK